MNAKRFGLFLSLLVGGCFGDDFVIDDGGPGEPDAGERFDAGADGGTDGATDAASDAAQSDAGEPDAFDAAADVFDAGMLDGGPDTSCIPSCVTGGECGADDGCGGRCLGVCPDDENQVCYGGICSMASWCVSSRCDPFSGTGCPSEDACYATPDPPNYIETSCEPPGVGVEGDTCVRAQDCSAGLGCRLGKCRRYCCHAGQLFTDSSDHCRGFCERIGARTGFCVETCSAQDRDACALDQVCVRSSERAGLTYCIETVAPDANEGDACTAANGCAHGHFCDVDTCRMACNPTGTDCGPGFECVTVSSVARVSVCRPVA